MDLIRKPIYKAHLMKVDTWSPRINLVPSSLTARATAIAYTEVGEVAKSFTGEARFAPVSSEHAETLCH